MSIYILNVFFPFIIYIVGAILGLKKKKLDRFLFSSVWLYIFFILALFNYQTFPDIETYNEYYSYLSKNSIVDLYYSYGTLMEYGYLLFNKLLTIINSDPRTLYIVRSIIFASGIIAFIRRHSCDYFISLVFFFLLFGLNQSIFVVRQYLALSIYLLSISSILDKNVKKYVFIWFLSFSIHKSMIICLPLYWLYHYYKIRNNNIIITSIIFILSSFLIQQISIVLAKHIGIYSSYLLNIGEDGNSAGLFLRAIVVFVPFLVFCKRKIVNDKNAKLLFWTSLMNVVMSIVLIGVPSGSRLYTNYNAFSMLTIAYVANGQASKQSKYMYLAIVFLIFVFLYFIRMSDYNYYFMWQDCNEYYLN